MKKTITKIFALILSLSLVFTFAACSNNSAQNETTSDVTTDDTGVSKVSKIAVIQYVSHPSLDNCYDGIVNAINNYHGDLSVKRFVGSDNAADSDCASYAKNCVAKKYDMIIAIATPAAIAAYAATEGTDIPVVFCSVSDPVSAKLVESMETPGDLCTGTSDLLDFDSQVKLIKSLQPSVEKIGVLYTTSEPNSISQLNTFKEVCKKYDVEVVASGIQNDSDIPAAASALAKKVDCINNFTDNKVVNNLSVVLSAAEEEGIPVYGSEVEQVKNGCLAAASIDYVSLGEQTGEMAISVLNGSDIKTMSVQTVSQSTAVINTDVLASFNITLPDEYKDAETVTTNEK